MNRVLHFRVWTGIKMEYNVGISNYGAFYCAGIDPKDTASLNGTTLYSENYPVMQYTGFNDINNRRIFVDDILELNGTLNYKVYWDGYRWNATCPYYHKYHWPCFNESFRFDAKNSIIVGNIYQHPHLLDKK